MGVTTYWFGRFELSPSIGEGARRAIEYADDNVIRRRAIGGRNGWISTPDGSALVWDQAEKFNEGVEWLRELLEAELAETRVAGSVFGFCSPECMSFEAIRIDVVDSKITEVRYEIPDLGDTIDMSAWEGEGEDDPEDLDDALFAISRMDGATPDYESSARVLDCFLDIVPLSSTGQLGSFLDDLVAALGPVAAPLSAVLDRRRG